MKKILVLALALALLATACTPVGQTTQSKQDATATTLPTDVQSTTAAVPTDSQSAATIAPIDSQLPAATILTDAPVTISETTTQANDSSVLSFAMRLATDTFTAQKNNPVISPLSAYIALAMAANGANNETLGEFETLLGGNIESINALCRSYMKKLNSTNGSTVFTAANSAWADERANIYESYIEELKKSFDAQSFCADLQAMDAINSINNWISENTNGMIEKLHDTPYNDDAVFVLINALYMKAEWLDKFEANMTYDKAFTLENGEKKQVPFMNADNCNRLYISTDGVEGIALPYDDGKTSFVALRTTSGQSIREFVAALDTGKFSSLLDGATQTLVNLSIPKFTKEFSLDMNKLLQNMGLVSAFDSNSADLSRLGVGQNGNLFISQVFQKVKIDVNEEGTEAAAVTEVVANDGCIMMTETPIDVFFDSPFMYAVIDNETQIPLFVGIMDDPS